MRYWWVNHKQTVKQEIGGQYLWSPKTETNGARSEFYNNMRRASPGDLVVSYADQTIKHVGRVAEFAFTAPKPEEFGDTGAYWSNEGWLLPVFWTPLFPPVRPKAVLESIKRFLPSRYSPINPTTGGGNQKAYLASIPEQMFDILITNITFSREMLRRGGSNSLNYQVVIELLEDSIQRRIAEDIQIEDTIKKSVILARRGQGVFRANVESVESECRLTGVTNRSLLIASHIKPWRSCQSAQERLDGENGLLLTPDADLLFDRGFISFQDNGEVLVSPRIDPTDLRRLGFDRLVEDHFRFAMQPVPGRTRGFRSTQHGYLAYHRSDVWVS
ncbi:HNH endonuclease [Rhizobium laguerreae]|uniref:HNH endonuclease n=1 Tax=Rhizobium laguerreae TaxID=1076926 RepID=UPI0013D1A300|nr:HNH endonuclease [Rhizobium laguerreae]